MPADFLGYTVYEDGRIWRPSRTWVRGGNLYTRKAGWVATRIRNASKGAGGGYEFVDLQDARSGTKRTYLVHRVVALAFIPTGDTSQDVNHKDGVRSNNAVANLEWLSRSENQKHAYRTGVRQDVGERHRLAKMSDAVASTIHALRAEGKSLLEIAAVAGVNFRTISQALKGKHSVTRGTPPTPDQRCKEVSSHAVWQDVCVGLSKKNVCEKYGLSRSTVWKMCKKERDRAEKNS